jgi:hypothetical protein
MSNRMMQTCTCQSLTSCVAEQRSVNKLVKIHNFSVNLSFGIAYMEFLALNFL